MLDDSARILTLVIAAVATVTGIVIGVLVYSSTV